MCFFEDETPKCGYGNCILGLTATLVFIFFILEGAEDFASFNFETNLAFVGENSVSGVKAEIVEHQVFESKTSSSSTQFDFVLI